MCGSMNIIGICGPMGGGKSTIGRHLETLGYERIPMAAALKDMLKALGLDDLDLNGPPSHKNAPNDLLCGKSPRYAMQSLGTEWARRAIGYDLWVNVIQARIIAHQTKCATRRRKVTPGCRGVVIDDIRFPNEWAMLERLGATLWCIRRPEVERKRRWFDRLLGRFNLFPFIHESEFHWPDAPVDAEFWNTGTEQDLKDQVQAFLGRSQTEQE